MSATGEPRAERRNDAHDIQVILLDYVRNSKRSNDPQVRWLANYLEPIAMTVQRLAHSSPTDSEMLAMKKFRIAELEHDVANLHSNITSMEEEINKLDRDVKELQRKLHHAP